MSGWGGSGGEEEAGVGSERRRLSRFLGILWHVCGRRHDELLRREALSGHAHPPPHVRPTIAPGVPRRLLVDLQRVATALGGPAAWDECQAGFRRFAFGEMVPEDLLAILSRALGHAMERCFDAVRDEGRGGAPAYQRRAARVG